MSAEPIPLGLLIQIGHDMRVFPYKLLSLIRTKPTCLVSQPRHLVPNLCCRSDAKHDLFSQYYAFAALSIYFYDYFLTLPDEVCRGSLSNIFATVEPPLTWVRLQVRYAWSGKKTWSMCITQHRPLPPLTLGQHSGFS